MVKVKCTNCGYEWEYLGKAIMATCPSCIRKTKAREIDVKAEEPVTKEPEKKRRTIFRLG